MSKATAATLRARAKTLLDWPLAETTTEDGKTVIKPARWSLADVPRLLQLADELDPPQDDNAGAFPASPATPGQAESRASWRELQASEKKPAWWSDFLLIREQFPHFRNWRIWVYIAWAGSPAATRTPRTLEELAAGVLGCSSRVVRKWRAASWGDKPGVDDAVAWVQAAPLMAHRRDVYEALVTVAKMADPKAHQDRRLFLELSGDYKPAGAKAEEKEQAQMSEWLAELRRAA